MLPLHHAPINLTNISIIAPSKLPVNGNRTAWETGKFASQAVGNVFISILYLLMPEKSAPRKTDR